MYEEIKVLKLKNQDFEVQKIRTRFKKNESSQNQLSVTKWVGNGPNGVLRPGFGTLRRDGADGGVEKGMFAFPMTETTFLFPPTVSG